ERDLPRYPRWGSAPDFEPSRWRSATRPRIRRARVRPRERRASQARAPPAPADSVEQMAVEEPVDPAAMRRRDRTPSASPPHCNSGTPIVGAHSPPPSCCGLDPSAPHAFLRRTTYTASYHPLPITIETGRRDAQSVKRAAGGLFRTEQDLPQ